MAVREARPAIGASWLRVAVEAAHLTSGKLKNMLQAADVPF